MEQNDLTPMEDIRMLAKKEEAENKPMTTFNEIANTQNDTSIMDAVKKEENPLLSSTEYKEFAKRTAEERIKSDLAKEASRIRKKNIETAETLFESETREKRLEHLKAELDLDHKYRMATLREDNEHKQMLDKRRKLVEKYGYLYDMSEKNVVEKYDSKNEKYLCPKDFTYSKFVNRMRQFGRNMSKLDKPILQSIKWIFIIGLGALAIFLLKHFGII